MHWWVRQYPVTQAAEEAQVSEATGIQAYPYLRDIMQLATKNDYSTWLRMHMHKRQQLALRPTGNIQNQTASSINILN